MAPPVTLWTPAKLGRAAERWNAGETVEIIASVLGVTPNQVYAATRNYPGLFQRRRDRKRWTEAEVAEAARLWAQGVSLEAIAQRLGVRYKQADGLVRMHRDRFPPRTQRRHPAAAAPPRATQPEIPPGDIVHPAPLPLSPLGAEPGAPPAGLGDHLDGKGARVDAGGEVVVLSARLPDPPGDWQQGPQWPRGCLCVLGEPGTPGKTWRWCNAPKAPGPNGVKGNYCADHQHLAARPKPQSESNGVTRALPPALPRFPKGRQQLRGWE